MSESEVETGFVSGFLQHIEPYWDNNLKTDQVLRVRFLQRLAEIGLGVFRRSFKSNIGFFTVEKKGGKQRLVLDARSVNSCYRQGLRAQRRGGDLRRNNPFLTTILCVSGVLTRALDRNLRRGWGISRRIATLEGRGPWILMGGVPEPSPEFRREELWQPVVRGAWRAPEAIHLKEARVCLLGLRRFCRHASARDCHVLTLTDNLSSALCFER
eukprot:402437-Amphidinium_carterae.2